MVRLLPIVNATTDLIIGASIAVHRVLGPGLLESAYVPCLTLELHRRNLDVVLGQPVPVIYQGIRIDCGYKMDMVVNDLVIVEIKSVAQLAPIHEAQLLTYLKLTGYPIGLLINFNVPLLKQGVRRRLNPNPAARFLS